MKPAIRLLGVLLLGGCTLMPAPPAERATFDLGTELPVPVRDVRLAVPLTLAQVMAAPGLDSRAIVYRLAYQDGARLRAYTLSRWADEPAALVGQRIGSALGQVSDAGVVGLGDGVTAAHMLRVVVERFDQVLDTPGSARGVVRLRASLVDVSKQRLVAQRVFDAERAAPAVDAAGAVRAIRDATDTAVAQLVRWVAGQSAMRP